MTTDLDAAATSWVPRLSKGAGPLYAAIADALAADILAGRLADGFRLPTQRALAEALGIDFTTVGRAYAEAGRRGLVVGRVGQGTFVRSRRRDASSDRGGLVDMSMNLPPHFDDPALVARMWEELGDLRGDDGLDLLLRYQAPGGTMRDREAGARWLEPRLGARTPERILVCPGAQGALLALLGVLAAPGDTIAAEALTYPGLLAAAAHMRLGVDPVALDASGIIPEAFEELCLRRKPKVLCVNPTLHNPTTTTVPLDRRRRLVDFARRHGVRIIEDDAYGALAPDAPPPLAAIGEDVVYYIAGLSKCLSPALRVAYLVAPSAGDAASLMVAIRATASMASPLTAALATRWLETGTADATLDAIRRETKARQAIVRSSLDGGVQMSPGAFHAWLNLPEHWTRGALVARLRAEGVGLVPSDAFAVADAPEAVRLGLGAPRSAEALKQSLDILSHILAQRPDVSTLVV